jgi:hypothetical protein
MAETLAWGTAMLKACPHCKAPLQPGEQYLGWCGECGNSFWQLPEGSAKLPPFKQPGHAAPIPAEWRWVARGALLKLVALMAGTGASLSIAHAAQWDAGRAFNAPFPVGGGVLLAAVALDVVGRLLCLATPQAAIRWLIIVSVGCQLMAVGMALGMLLMPPGTDGRWTLLMGAVLGQIVAAVTFTFYLFAVGVYFRNGLVMALAALIKAIMTVAAGIVALTACLVMVVVLLVVVLSCLTCIGWWAFLPQLVESVVKQFAVPLSLVLALVELAYGATLAAVCWELGRRKMLRR